MTQIIRAQDRYHLESDWLSAYWLFSFDRYYDPNNLNFGPLRVFNHDTIAGGGGFPTHSHREMEIVTYVLQGTLAHQDSTGGRGLIHPGEVQRMTAGTGISHSELNASASEPVKLMQIWLTPESPGLKPGYEQKQFSLAERTGKLLPIVAGNGQPGALKIHQDATFYVGRLDASDTVTHALKAGRRAFLYVIEGALQYNEDALATGDQARITQTESLALTAAQTSEIILIDLP